MASMFFAHALSRPEVKKDWKIIGLVGVGHAGSHFSHLLLPLMFPIFSQVFGLGYAQLGLSVSVFFVISGIGQALSGFFVDRFGAVPVLLAALGCLVLGCLVASQVNGLGGLVLTAVLLPYEVPFTAGQTMGALQYMDSLVEQKTDRKSVV